MCKIYIVHYQKQSWAQIILYFHHAHSLIFHALGTAAQSALSNFAMSVLHSIQSMRSTTAKVALLLLRHGNRFCGDMYRTLVVKTTLYA